MSSGTIAGQSAEAYDPFGGDALVSSGATTDAQREVLTAARMGDEANLAYNEATRITFTGPLDEARLTSAVQSLYRRHDALRMTFSRDDEAFFVWQRDLAVERLQVQDVAAIEAAAREAVARPFDVDEGPLFRAILLTAASAPGARTDLVLVAHHLVCDGWSLTVLIGELFTLYASPDQPLPDAPRFADYAAREPAARADTDAFWAQQFDGSVPTLELPATGARSPARSLRSARIDREVPQALIDGMRAVASRNQTTLFSGMLAATAVTVSRLTTADDVVLAVPSAGQAAAGMPGLVGHCVNVLPVRVFVDPQETVDRFVRRVGTRMFDVQDHQEYTLGRLLQSVVIPRVPGHVPVTPVMFNLDQGIAVDQPLQGTGVTATLHSVPRVSEYFEIFLNLVQHPGQPLVIECQYNTTLFTAELIREWLDGYVAVLAQMVEDGTQPVQALTPIAPATLARLQRDWQGPVRPAPSPALVHEWIAATAAAQADAIAVRDATGSLSYRALLDESASLASALQAQGARPGTRVAVSVSRTRTLPLALQAVMATGAAYVPLDLDYPADRLRFMLEDSAPVAWVVDGPLPEALRALDVPVLDLRVARTALVPPRPWSAPVLDAATTPAYVIYTSGSTGRPKGVAVPHAAVSNFLLAMQEALPVSASDRFLALTTLSFDIAVLELLLPLVLGACTCIVDRDTARDPGALASTIDRFGVSVMQATPSTWRLLLDAGWTGRSGLMALSGGETLPSELASRLRPLVAQLWNMFGPTETTVWSTVHRVEAPADSIPIGRPIANTTIAVVDGRNRPVPVGVAGELCIGGAGLALGYHNRPELTAERFVSLALRNDERLYRTGDLATWRPDGVLMLLGRIDAQVKLRGFRIELGEIEAVLGERPEVAAAAARVWDDGRGDARIAAYVVPAHNQTVHQDALLAHLAARLPGYMVPQHLLTLDALPQTPNGKLDRNALPDIRLHGAAQRVSLAEWSATERMVAEVWQEVLGIPVGDRSADFFQLGGHSILAARVIGRLEKRLAITIGLRTLFEASRLDDFARRLPVDGGTAWEELRI